MPTIRDGRATLDVILLHPPAADAQPAVSGGADFLAWWKREAALRNAPTPRFAGADRRLATILVSRHGMRRLKELGTAYWRRHAEMRGHGLFEMVAFASRIPVIEAELSSQVAT